MQKRIIIETLVLISLCVFCLLDVLPVNGQNLGSWTEKTSMPTARRSLALAVVNGNIYAIGGGVSSEGILDSN